MKPQFQTRLAHLRASMTLAEQDASLIFSLDNLRYLFNYTGEAAYGLVTHNAMYLITDYRFVEQAQEECVSEDIQTTVVCRDRDRQTLGQAIASLLQQEKSQHCWFEADQMNVAMWEAIALDNKAIHFTPSTNALERQRKTKDAWEIAQMRKAANIADQALAMLVPQLKLGVSERDMAIELDYQMQKLGSEGVSFQTILGFGERSALPHCIPSHRRLQAGDLIVLDFGAVVNGYRSDMTRSFVAGKADAQQKAMYGTVFSAQRAALNCLKDGVAAAHVNAASSAILDASSFAKYAGPGLGHGVGIKLHEQPFIGPFCKEHLRTNYVVTIEPGIYIPQYGGIRLEDDVLITEDGFDYITHAPKQFELDC